VLWVLKAKNQQLSQKHITLFSLRYGGNFMQSDINNEIKKLSISERILLVEDIWDSIARENESFELSQSQKDELEERSLFLEKNPSQGRTWEEIKSEFLNGNKSNDNSVPSGRRT
jgi:putative addiction module component (TIGR02574 family)